jgi:hypothetical protein
MDAGREAGRRHGLRRGGLSGEEPELHGHVHREMLRAPLRNRIPDGSARLRARVQDFDDWRLTVGRISGGHLLTSE